MTFKDTPRTARPRVGRMASIGFGMLAGASMMAMGQGTALAADGATVVRGYPCRVGGETTTNSFAGLTPSGNAQSSCHAAPEEPGPASGGGAVVLHDVRCNTFVGPQMQSVFVFTPSGAANAVCLAKPGT